MTGNTSFLFHECLAMILCLAGFHVLFFTANLAKKAMAWCIFQMGLMNFLLAWAPSSPLAITLAIEGTAVAVAILLLLMVFVLKLRRRYKTYQGDEIARKVSR